MNENRIGVITYWGICNIGSYLQSFALQQVLKQNGYKPCIIQVQETGLFYSIRSKIKLLFKLVLHPTFIPTFLELRRMGLQTISDVPVETKGKFEKDQELVDTIEVDYGHLRKLANTNEFVAFICGSDQIWNPLGFVFRDYKYLGFAPKNKRVAYAPSFGVDYVPSYNRKQVINGLKGMRSISVREKQGATIVEQLLGIKVPVVLDPTLLLSRAEWEKWETDIKLPDNFVAFFFLSEPDEESIKEVKRLGEGKTILCFPKAYGLDGCENTISLSVGPLDFLRVINKASLVCTDSFHGVALSTIYEKPITVFRRTHKEKYNQFSRIENILELTNNNKCIFGSGDYNGPSFPDISRISDEKEKSISYLLNAIRS